MISLICGLFFIISCSEGHLVFPKGSDIGYIVPDAVQELESNAIIREPLDELKKKELLSRQTREEGRLSPFSNFWLPNNLLKNLAGREDADLSDSKHGVKMGIATVQCDDALHNLTVDWNYSPANYTCYNPRQSLPPATSLPLQNVKNCNIPPEDYSPQHFCMNHTITYKDRIPSFGDHRPLWGTFGEYKFLPPQRWLHNIEHGSVVLLYHPCTRPSMVSELKAIVKGCLYKHIITPYTPLTPERPLALVAWGCTLEMSTVDPTEVVQFIKDQALQGPEGYLRKQGQFTEGLISASKMPDSGFSDKDLSLCPI